MQNNIEKNKALRQKPEFETVEKVLERSKVNAYLIRLLTENEIKALTEVQIQALKSVANSGSGTIAETKCSIKNKRTSIRA